MTSTTGSATDVATHAFHPLCVQEVNRLTDDAVELAFTVPPELANAYRFQHGQHVAVRLEVGGEELRRNYSITSTLGDPVLRIGVRHANEGRVSSILTSQIAPGDTLEVMTPSGRFTAPLDPAAQRHWLLIAAGSGITPLMSILRSVLDSEPNSSVTLLYCNRAVGTIMFREEIDALKSEHASRLSVLHFLTRERRNVGLLDGRITGDKLRQLATSAIDLRSVTHAFVCGPQHMTIELRQTLLDLGLQPERVHVELFGVDLPPSPRAVPAEDADVVARATVVMHGIETVVEVRDGERILDAARRAGLDVPFACTGGVCATCRAHVGAGAVEMVANYALDEREVQNGYALTCQSLPRTKVLTVDFDRP